MQTALVTNNMPPSRGKPCSPTAVLHLVICTQPHYHLFNNPSTFTPGARYLHTSHCRDIYSSKHHHHCHSALRLCSNNVQLSIDSLLRTCRDMTCPCSGTIHIVHAQRVAPRHHALRRVRITKIMMVPRISGTALRAYSTQVQECIGHQT